MHFRKRILRICAIALLLIIAGYEVSVLWRIERLKSVLATATRVDVAGTLPGTNDIVPVHTTIKDPVQIAALLKTIEQSKNISCFFKLPFRIGELNTDLAVTLHVYKTNDCVATLEILDVTEVIVDDHWGWNSHDNYDLWGRLDQLLIPK